MYTYIYNVYIYIYIYSFCVYMRICIYIYTYLCIYICVCIMYACWYLCVWFKWMYMYIYIYIYIYAHINAYTCIYHMYIMCVWVLIHVYLPDCFCIFTNRKDIVCTHAGGDNVPYPSTQPWWEDDADSYLHLDCSMMFH